MERTDFYNEATGINCGRYKSSKGLISLAPPSWATMSQYEIYCLEGDLFEDIERYSTLEEAETRIKKLLDSD